MKKRNNSRISFIAAGALIAFAALADPEAFGYIYDNENPADSTEAMYRLADINMATGWQTPVEARIVNEDLGVYADCIYTSSGWTYLGSGTLNGSNGGNGGSGNGLYFPPNSPWSCGITCNPPGGGTHPT